MCSFFTVPYYYAQFFGVLGGISTAVNSGNDANSLVSPGNYFWGSYTYTPQNMPLQMAGWMRVDVFGIMIVQRVFYNFGGGSTNPSAYERIKWGDDWGDWSRLDNFGCNTLAELKAALANV